MPRPRRTLSPVCPEQPPEPFSAGSLTVAQACEEFGGFTRQRLFELMHAGELEWSQPVWAKGRILCRASIQRYLRRHQGRRTSDEPGPNRAGRLGACRGVG